MFTIKSKFKIFYRRKRKSRKTRSKSHPSFLLHQTTAHHLISSRLIHFSELYKTSHGVSFTYHKISIRNQSSRWGSCSRKGNLSFNFRLALIPPELADYVIVHELCHLAEFNHSRNFWKLVELAVPNWRKLRRELKEHGKKLF